MKKCLLLVFAVIFGHKMGKILIVPSFWLKFDVFDCIVMIFSLVMCLVAILTLFSMGYFKNTTVWGAIMAPLLTSLLFAQS